MRRSTFQDWKTMLRRVILCLFALSLVLGGPAFAHASHGVVQHGDGLCTHHAGTGAKAGHHGDGAGNPVKADTKLCCQTHCPSQILVEPALLAIGVVAVERVGPVVFPTLSGRTAPPDTPPPRS